MKAFFTLAASLALAALPLRVEAGSVQAAERLLQAAHADTLVDKIMAQMGQAMKMTANQAAHSHGFDAAQQAQLNQVCQQVLDSMRQNLTWAKLKPVYIKTYTESFTDEEMNGIADFYQTPIGQALLQKLPLVMQNAMAAMQPLLMDTMRGAQTRLQECIAQIESKHPAKAG